MRLLSLWSFVGLIAGIWKLAALGIAASFFVWKKGLWRHPLWRFARPWTASNATASVRPRTGPSPAPRAASASSPFRRFLLVRWKWIFWMAALLAAGAWVCARLAISESVGMAD